MAGFELQKAIETAVNIHSAENGSDTPDWVLARYLMDCLRAFDTATIERRNFYRGGEWNADGATPHWH